MQISRLIRYRHPAPFIASVFGLFAVASAGCTAMPGKSPSAAGDELARCEYLFETMDNAVKEAGVQDGGAMSIQGFPYLRIDRFLASYREEPMGPDATAWWVKRMQRLDLRARSVELANLPEAHRSRIPDEFLPPGNPTARLTRCADRLLARDLADAAAMKRLRAAAEVRDDYQTWKRILGLYPVTALAFYRGILGYQADTRETFSTPLGALPVTGRLIGYEPAPASTPQIGPTAVALDRFRDNPLGVPIPDGPDLDRLFAVHAPLIEVDEFDRNDRIGIPTLSKKGAAYIDTARPKVFVRIAHARYRGEPLLQLIYSIWFPARPKTSGLDLLGGHLDSLIWRVTLGNDGKPLLYDSVHSCGCYHMFFPTPRARLRLREPVFEEPILIPAQLGSQRPGERIVLRVASGTHYIQNVRYDSGLNTDQRRPYRLESDDYLRSLVWPGSGRRSLYRPDGIVPGSERGERYLYWPMGVREPGSMRQWGRHATAFVGRRHFDDPGLIERFFEL